MQFAKEYFEIISESAQNDTYIIGLFSVNPNNKNGTILLHGFWNNDSQETHFEYENATKYKSVDAAKRAIRKICKTYGDFYIIEDFAIVPIKTAIKKAMLGPDFFKYTEEDNLINPW